MLAARHIVSTLSLCVIALSGCSETEPEPESAADPVETEALAMDRAIYDAAVEVELRNARLPETNLVTGGQPDQEQIEALRAAGAQTFVSLRAASESGAGWEELYAAEEGLEFARLPIDGADGLTRENVEIFAGLMEGQDDRPVVLYCGSSNRVGAMVALKAHWIDGVGPEEALEMGREAGMTRLEGRVRELLGLEG